ncbi:MAG: hypothetical protein KGY80_03965 [Candidatus Thorarchaeota archaeon]|nr:hypothetical protein [Candidatus Thorarchaeota archaeon]
MQLLGIMDAVVSLTSLSLGIGTGYVIGGLKDAGRLERIALGALISVIGGVLISLLFGTYLMTRLPPIPLQIVAFTVGTITGGVWHWQTPVSKDPDRHIIFEPDDDEEFEREIEEAFETKE